MKFVSQTKKYQEKSSKVVLTLLNYNIKMELVPTVSIQKHSSDYFHNHEGVIHKGNRRVTLQFTWMHRI